MSADWHVFEVVFFGKVSALQHLRPLLPVDVPALLLTGWNAYAKTAAVNIFEKSPETLTAELSGCWCASCLKILRKPQLTMATLSIVGPHGEANMMPTSLNNNQHYPQINSFQKCGPWPLAEPFGESLALSYLLTKMGLPTLRGCKSRHGLLGQILEPRSLHCQPLV
eukprot:3012807-Amphidinium_carterae.2